MESLYRTVVQLEEAKRLVTQGDVAHLRLALILLDNAVEVMMHRVIEGRLRHANTYARMLENFPKGPLDPEGEKIRAEISSEVVPLKQQKQIRRIFGEKIAFLSKDHDCIPGPTARALRHLHDYRNETQHQDQVRSESIKPAVLILFDIATDFLVRLQPGTTAWIGGENYDWLKKYGIRNPRLIHMSEEMRPRIAKKLRSGLPLDAKGTVCSRSRGPATQISRFLVFGGAPLLHRPAWRSQPFVICKKPLVEHSSKLAVVKL